MSVCKLVLNFAQLILGVLAQDASHRRAVSAFGFSFNSLVSVQRPPSLWESFLSAVGFEVEALSAEEAQKRCEEEFLGDGICDESCDLQECVEGEQTVRKTNKQTAKRLKL